VASDHAQRAKGLENRVEEMYRAALADLLARGGHPGRDQDDEIARGLSTLEQRSDRVDEAANVIGDIIVKIT